MPIMFDFGANLTNDQFHDEVILDFINENI